MKKKSVLAKCALITTTIIWGAGFVAVKYAVEDIAPVLLLALRFTIAGILLSAVFFYKLKLINAKYLLNGAVLGTVLFCAYAFQTVGITGTTPGKNAFLTAVYCVLVPFLYWIIEKKQPEMRHFLAAVFCIAGIGLVSLTDELTINTGDLLTLISGLFFGIHVVFVSRYTKSDHGDAVLYTIIQFAVCAVLSWIFSLIFESFPESVSSLTVYSLLFLAVPSTAVALLLQIIGQKYTHPAAASILLSLESVFGVLFSVFIYGETLTQRILLGFCLIFAAVLISETRTKKKDRTAE